MNQPTSGGQYVRDPETGALTKVTEAPTQEPATTTNTETETPVVKAASGKGNRNG
ncbi:hypothetical protein [Agrobacterium larrymoorei]|uniref:Uncharacterized protein n=1 Tax=Agrobacterium larrymoorei TaxID=160699 RepID=A0ABU0UKC7_9HYPH|nr:hypothetical protein [Agrobacterium larrymoorei]MDQ1185411.1 hypothetical protein [Agrobacterium larrymoorei]